MAWEEARGASRAASAVARRQAHADDAKARTHEGSRLPVRSLRPRILAGAGAALLLLALVAFLATRGGDDGTPSALATTRPTPSASPSEESVATPAEVLEESQPSGVWKLVVKGRNQTTRGGATTPLKQREDPVEWTFPTAACSDAQCSGEISSSSGKEFPFVWDGGELDVTLGGKTQRGQKAACVDTETGEVKPIEEAAARLTYHFAWGPFVATPDKMTARSTTRTTYEFFGTCEPHDSDLVKATYVWVLTPTEQS